MLLMDDFCVLAKFVEGFKGFSAVTGVDCFLIAVYGDYVGFKCTATFEFGTALMADFSVQVKVVAHVCCEVMFDFGSGEI